MVLLEREDILGRNATLVVKPRGSGETTVSTRLESDLGFETAVVNLTSANNEPKWQGQFHCHHYQRELYLVVVGVVVAVWWSPDGDRAVHEIYKAGESFSFPPRVFHDILTLPGSEHVTVKVPIVPGVDVAKDREVLEPPKEAAEKMEWLLGLAKADKL